MPLELHPLQEADLAAAVEVMWQSFKPDIMGCIWPRGFTQAARGYTIAKGLESWRKSPEKIKKMKVIDTDLPDDDPLGKIVGYSDWYFYPKQRTEEELKEKEGHGGDDDLPPDCDKEMLREFGDQLDAAKMKYIGGRPYIELHILVTHPKHHRRGVGAMQLRWGFEHAEKLGLPVYLESSPIGRPLYAREGFEALGVLPFDARKFGFEKELQHTLMLRQVMGNCVKDPVKGRETCTYEATDCLGRKVGQASSRAAKPSSRPKSRARPALRTQNFRSTQRIRMTLPQEVEHRGRTSPSAPARSQHGGTGRPPPTGSRALENMRHPIAHPTGLTHLAQTSNPFARASTSGGNVGMLSSGSNPFAEQAPAAEGALSSDATATRPALSAKRIVSSVAMDVPNADVVRTPETGVPAERDLTMLADVLVDQAGDGEGAIRLINEIVRPSVMQYGRSVLQNKHISGMLVEGELNWIIASLSPDLAQALSAATKHHDPAATTSTDERTAADVGNAPDHHLATPVPIVTTSARTSRRFRGSRGARIREPHSETKAQPLADDTTVLISTPAPSAPGNTQLGLVQTAPCTLGESSTLQHHRTTTKRKPGGSEDTQSDGSNSDAEQRTLKPSSHASNISFLGQDHKDSAEQDDAVAAQKPRTTGGTAAAPKGIVVCKFFLEGRCKFGGRVLPLYSQGARH
ncbi:hypothetical protein LTR17_019822 [Elasticomyces elasticus]|nr:hypothetical protein LTR17_019822 [Elasticomyces elasticus]